jgi:hypothetical protein
VPVNSSKIIALTSFDGDQDIYFENPYFIAYDFQNKTTRNRLTGPSP